MPGLIAILLPIRGASASARRDSTELLGDSTDIVPRLVACGEAREANGEAQAQGVIIRRLPG